MEVLKSEKGRDCFLNFLGVGARKCATTWIAEALRHHPQVFFSRPKELHFFSYEKYWSKGIDWYRTHFENSSDFRAIGEFSSTYLTNPIALDRISRLFPDVKIIVSLRNPVDRFISHYRHHIVLGRLSPRRFRKLKIDRFQEAIKRLPPLLDDGFYSEGVAGCFSRFGKDRTCVLLQEKIKTDPGSELKRLYRFLEIDQESVPPRLRVKIGRSFVPRYERIDMIRRRVLGTTLASFPRLLDAARFLGLGNLYRLTACFKESEFLVADEVIKKLEEIYRDDIEKTEHLIGKKLRKQYQRIVAR